jgi:hypothetical protein
VAARTATVQRSLATAPLLGERVMGSRLATPAGSSAVGLAARTVPESTATTRPTIQRSAAGPPPRPATAPSAAPGGTFALSAPGRSAAVGASAELASAADPPVIQSHRAAPTGAGYATGGVPGTGDLPAAAGGAARQAPVLSAAATPPGPVRVQRLATPHRPAATPLPVVPAAHAASTTAGTTGTASAGRAAGQPITVSRAAAPGTQRLSSTVVQRDALSTFTSTTSRATQTEAKEVDVEKIIALIYEPISKRLHKDLHKDLRKDLRADLRTDFQADLRADFRIERERFGRLRDSTR